MGSNRKSIRPRDIQFPNRLMGNMIDDYINGSFNDYSFLFRAIVVKVDTIGGMLSGPGTPMASEFPNPKNSIRARIIGKDRYKSTDDLTVFWPMFTHDTMPVVEGEHVYVLFEDPNEEVRGLWLCRIPEPKNVSSTNFVNGNAKYPDAASAVGIDQAIADTPTSPDPISQSLEFVKEAVPSFRPRVGDRVIEGSNNTIIILGNDRPSDINSGVRSSAAGTIQIIAGRDKDDDLDINADKSVVYITMQSDIDENFGTGDIGDKSIPSPAIAAKSDEIRIIANKGMKIVVTGGKMNIQASGDINIKSDSKVTVEAPNINIGSNNSKESLVLGDALLNNVLTPLISALDSDSKGGSAFGIPATVILPGLMSAIPSINSALSNILSKKNKTE